MLPGMLFSDAAETVATATPRRRDDAPLADMSVEFNEALQQKVQSQADELIMKTRELGTARSYGELCERRLLELAPGHALPVTEASLGDFPDPLAEAPHQRSDGSQVKNPKDVSGIPAYIVAKNALVRKVERECEEQIFALKKAMRALEERNSEMSSQLKRSRLERDAKEREAKFLGRNMQALQTSLADARKALKELKDQQPARSVDEVKRLRQAAVELRAQTEAAQDALQEEQLRCKVFEDALEVRATELPGLDGKASLLADLAKLRGEATAATKTVAAKDAQVQRAEGRLAEVQARNAVLSQQLTTDRAELQRISTELARLNTREASETIAMLSKANAQLESEKGALLDYIQDSVDRGAQANTELAQKSEALANLEEDAAQLHAQCEELAGASEALSGANATIQTKDIALGQLRTVRAELEAALATKESEKEEMQSLQLELLQQLKDSADERARTTAELDGSLKAAAVFEERNQELATSLQQLKGEAQVSSSRLADFEVLERTLRGDISALQTRVQELTKKSAHIERMEAHATAMNAELAMLRPFRAALEAVERDLGLAETSILNKSTATATPTGTHQDLDALADASSTPYLSGSIVGATTGSSSASPQHGSLGHLRGANVQQKHAVWCSSASLRALSELLHERIRSIYMDLCQRDNEASEALSTLEYERRERGNERSSLTEQISVRERSLSSSERRERQAQDQSRILRDEVEKGRSLQQIITEIRSVLSTASRVPVLGQTGAGGGSNSIAGNSGTDLVDIVDLPRMVAQQLQAKNEAVGRIQALEARISDMTSAQASSIRELEATTSAKLAAETYSATVDSDRRREASEQRIEVDHLRSELEGAAELAEQQNALVLTLEGRLETICAEKHSVTNQLVLLGADVDQHRADLELVLREAAPLLRTSSAALHVRAGGSDDMKTAGFSGLSPSAPLLNVTQSVSSTMRSLVALANELPGTKEALRACQGSADRLQGVVRSLEIANQVSQRENQSLRHQLFGRNAVDGSSMGPRAQTDAAPPLLLTPGNKDKDGIDVATTPAQPSAANVVVHATPSEALIEQHRRELVSLQQKYKSGSSRLQQAKASFSAMKKS